MAESTAGVAAITGASGLIGTALRRSLESDGWRVKRLVRAAVAGPDQIAWQPGAALNPAELSGVDVVVGLAGAGVGDHRWTAAYKEAIRSSRVDGTETLATAIAQMDRPPRVFVSASAMGFYGDTGQDAVTERSPKGRGFLADVVAQWEGAADAARAAGIRTVHPRTSLVVSRRGGAWARMIPLFRAGVGGRLGTGRQFWSFISLRDEVAALRFLIDSQISGPVNLSAPQAATNAEVTRAMARVLRRPAVLPVPGFALKAALGEFSTEVLTSCRLLPEVLTSNGFRWQDPTIDDAIRAALQEH